MSSPLPIRVAVAVGAPAVAYAVQKLIWDLIPPSPHLLFYPAVFLAARVGGRWPGYVASVLSALAINWGFLPPAGLAIESARDALDLSVFCAVSFAMSYAVGRLAERIALERAAKEATQATWSMIAHDLRTPLHTIRMGSDLLVHGKDPNIRRQAEIIERSSLRAASLVQDALDAMRLGDGTLTVSPRPCSVRELVSRVADEASVIAARSGIRVETTVATTHAAVLCDRSRIAQVLANLLANAVRFTPRGGIIALFAEDENGQGSDVRITVRDTGAGIANEDIPKVFTKSWTKGGGGMGLGLWIAKSIVEAHRRTLHVSSDEGHGTAFTFTLPASDASPDNGAHMA